jgi:hypothetical protein
MRPMQPRIFATFEDGHAVATHDAADAMKIATPLGKFEVLDAEDGVAARVTCRSVRSRKPTRNFRAGPVPASPAFWCATGQRYARPGVGKRAVLNAKKPAW